MYRAIGQLLRKAREEKGLSLEDVQAGTKIQKNVLQYLEEGTIDAKLGPAYAKGFSKIYAKFLGLDLNLPLKDKQPLPEEPGQKEKTPRQILKTLIFNKLNFKFPKMAYLPRGKMKYIGIFLLILFLIILFAPKKKSSNPPESPKLPAVTAKVPLKDKDIPDKLSLLIRASENSWLQVKSDSKVVFQRVLTKGSVEKWEAKERIELWVGNAAGLQVELNGQKIGPLGRRGQVIKNIIMTKDGVTIGK